MENKEITDKTKVKRRYLTSRQKVLQVYPNATLEFRSRPQNTMRPTTWYDIRETYPNGKIIGRGRVRADAWRDAVKNLKE